MRHPGLSGIEVCVFDAYGTLFDVSSVARGARNALGEGWLALSDLWRSKQLQYTWLRGLAGHHADFWQVTGRIDGLAGESNSAVNLSLRNRPRAAFTRLIIAPGTFYPWS
jgi:2-haloacid dehalogenase